MAADYEYGLLDNYTDLFFWKMTGSYASRLVEVFNMLHLYPMHICITCEKCVTTDFIGP